MNPSFLRALAALAATLALFSAGPAVQGQSVPAALLPDAPLAAPAPEAAPNLADPGLLAQDAPLKLPRHWQPTYAADRSHLGDKLSYGFGSLFSIRNLIEAALIGGAPGIYDAPHQPICLPGESARACEAALDLYGQQIRPWLHDEKETLEFHGRRIALGLATAETRQLLSNLVLPLALHQDARYHPAPVDADFSERMENAAEAIVVTHDTHGRLVPNYSKLIGTFAAAWAAAHPYATLAKTPELNNNGFLFKYAAYSLLGDFATNAAHEMIRRAIQPDLDVYELHGRSTEDSYYPLSAGGKFIYWIRSTYAPRVWVEAGLTTSLFSIPEEPHAPVNHGNTAVYDEEEAIYANEIYFYRQAVEERIRYHARRLYAGATTVETQQFIQNFAVPMIAGIDPRYVPLGQGYTSGERWHHTVSSLWQARTDDGGHTINVPVLGGVFGSAILAQTVYYPQMDVPALASAKVFTATVVFNLAADVVGNIWSEFVHHRGY